jgi:DNA-binding transcriptional regulator YiaG
MARRKKDTRPHWDKDRVQALRQHLGITQQELADQLGTRQQTISEWERGLYEPRGASATLLFLVAEKAGFEYESGFQPEIKEGRKLLPPVT